MCAEVSKSTTIIFSEYDQQVRPTDRLVKSDLRTVLFGLFGEVGSFMVPAKKQRREAESYTGYQRALEEELGDIFWYLAAFLRRVNIKFTEVLPVIGEAASLKSDVAATDVPSWPFANLVRHDDLGTLDAELMALGEAAGALMALDQDAEREIIRVRVSALLEKLFRASQLANVNVSAALGSNMKKVRGRFLEPDYDKLPIFDLHFDQDESLPDKFEIVINEKKNGKSYLSWNGVFIGDPLTDNIKDPDGYRFHDVFHLAHAAVLHWSPVFRALIKHKRKSDPEVDESQDGGRAIVIEEAVTALIFAYAKDLNYFKGTTSVSFDILKEIQALINGYEVDQCPLIMWEKAILKGYAVFREVRANGGGIVVGDRVERDISYIPLETES